MGFFKKLFGGKTEAKADGNSFDHRSNEEKQIERNARNILSRELETYADELLGALERGEFDKKAGDMTGEVYWTKDHNLEGPLREKAKKIGNMQDLLRVYYRAQYLAVDRGIDFYGRNLSVLFDGIGGWKD